MTRRDVDKLQEEIEELFVTLAGAALLGLLHGFGERGLLPHDEPHALTVVVDSPASSRGRSASSRASAPRDRGRAQTAATARARLPADGDRVRPFPNGSAARRGRRPRRERRHASSRACSRSSCRSSSRRLGRPLPDQGGNGHDRDRIDPAEPEEQQLEFRPRCRSCR